ncbi:unnamed protein product [Diamesa tonsa]
MSSNILKLKQPVTMAMKVPSMELPKSWLSASKLDNIKKNIYERAVGQHVYKSQSQHSNPTRFGDFESKGRCSDF